MWCGDNFSTNIMMNKSMRILLSSLLLYALFDCKAKALQHHVQNDELAPCRIDYTQECSSVHPAQNYSIRLSSEEYSPKQMISVKVYQNSCPAFSSPEGPKWYTLEAFQDANNENKGRLYVGTFLQHFQRSEAQLCKHNAKVVFSTCEPNALDLPGLYEWSAINNIGRVCFRLTIQANATETCEVLEQCISPSSESSGGGPLAIDSLYSDFGSTDYNYHYLHEQHEHGTEATKEPEAIDQHTNSSVSEEEVETEEETFELKPTCQRDRDNLMRWGHYWKPVCDCSGYYKLIQCMKNPHSSDSHTVCWCSTKLGGEIAHSRKRLACVDPEEFSFFCSRANMSA